MSHDRIDPPWVIGANVGDDTSHWVEEVVGSMFSASGGDYDSETGLLTFPSIGGLTSFDELTDKATVDLPSINIPLALVLAGTAPSVHTHEQSDISGLSDFVTTTNYAITTLTQGKQSNLVSGETIKTINGASVLGSGDLSIPGSGTIDATPTDGSSNAVSSNGVFDALATKQATLVSGTSIKTINGASILGSGNLTISGGSSTISSAWPADSHAAIQGTASDIANVKRLDQAPYSISAPLLYTKDQRWIGQGRSFGGTTVVPSGNFSVLDKNTAVTGIDYTRNHFEGLLIDAQNVTSAYAVRIRDVYLTVLRDIWIKQATNGIEFIESDAVNIYDLMIMEDSLGNAVHIGDSARSIKFFGLNIERNPGTPDPGGTFLMDGAGINVSNASVFGGQTERARLMIERGQLTWHGGKINDSTVRFGPWSQKCLIEDAAFYGPNIISDFGCDNKILNVYGQNMRTPLHQWPALVSAAGTLSFPSVSGDEYLVLASIMREPSTSATGCKAQVLEGASLLSESPAVTLQAQGVSIGSQMKDTYSFLTAVRIGATANLNVSAVNCSVVALRGGKSLLSNSTFTGGASTGWSFVNASSSASGDDILVTPSASNWGIYRSIGSVLKRGKRYIAVAKYSGAASLCLGSVWDGTSGERKLFDSGVSDLWDTDSIAMLSFEAIGGDYLSLGALSSSSAVTVRWICLIECD